MRAVVSESDVGVDGCVCGSEAHRGIRVEGSLNGAIRRSHLRLISSQRLEMMSMISKLETQRWIVPQRTFTIMALSADDKEMEQKWTEPARSPME